MSRPPTFRGAEAAALGQLEARLGVPVSRFVLGTAHRQTPPLRELTSRVTERIGTAAAGMQRLAAAAESAPPYRRRLRSCASRHRRLRPRRPGSPARLREQHLLDGVPWNEMAVVVRSGAHVPALARALAVAEVPTKTSVAGRALRDDYAARQLITVIGVELGAVELTAPVATELLLGPFGGLDGVSLRRLRLALRQEELAGDGNRQATNCSSRRSARPGASPRSTPRRRAGRPAWPRRSHAGREKAAARRDRRRAALARLGAQRARQAMARAVGAQRDRRRRGQPPPRRGGRALHRRPALRRALRPRRPASDFVDELLEAEVPEDTLAAQTAADAVLVCTPSATIGAEFEVVAVAGLQESVWPNLRLRGSLLHPQKLGDAVAGSGVRRRSTNAPR